MASAILQNHSFYTIGLGVYNDLYINKFLKYLHKIDCSTIKIKFVLLKRYHLSVLKTHAPILTQVKHTLELLCKSYFSKLIYFVFKSLNTLDSCIY